MSKRELAEEIVENYALGHAGTAFIVGSFGGQFGADRVALTALTIKMINDICDVYAHDVSPGARAVHIASALGRLTVRGTVIAHTILNWIPFVGPAANSATTFHLTRKAGRECIRDIEADRMKCVSDQILMAGGRAAAMTLSDHIAEASEFAAEEIVNVGGVALDDGCDTLIECADSQCMEQVSAAINELRSVLLSEDVIGAETEFVKQTVETLTKQTLSGDKIDAGALLKANLARTFLVATMDLGSDLLANSKDVVDQQLLILQEVLPKGTWACLQNAASELAATSEETRKDCIKGLVNAIDTGLTVSREGHAFVSALCRSFRETEFRDGSVPFSDGGFCIARRKLAYLLYLEGFSANPDANWFAAKHILFSRTVAQEVGGYVQSMTFSGEASLIRLARSLSVTFSDWGLQVPSDVFFGSLATSIINDTDLLTAWIIRVPMITSYCQGCETAAYGVSIHVPTASDRENWLLAEAYADILSKELIQTHRRSGLTVLPDTPDTVQKLEEALRLVGIDQTAQPSYENLVKEDLFVSGTRDMAVLIALDAEANRAE